MTVHSRQEAIDIVAEASVSGYLGLFVGSGFSRAATKNQAPTFRTLMETLVPRLGLKEGLLAGEEYRFRSFPQVASQVLREYESVCQQRERAGDLFRREIADVCNLMPDPEIAPRLTKAMRDVAPSWVITTNYDLILESLLEEAQTVLQNQPVIARPDRVPILHLHGHRLNPSSIRVTEEDYVGLLGPLDYQRLKLPLLLAESSTLMLGYALGDINVRAAMSWAQSFSTSQGLQLARGQGFVLQALFVSGTPSPSPYTGPNGELVLETSDLAGFLQELADRRVWIAQQWVAVRESIEQFLSHPSTAKAVAHAGVERATFLDIVARALPFPQTARIIEFLDRSLEPIWERARADGGFEHYDTYLALLVDILAVITVRQCNPALLAFLADALERVGSFISPTPYAYGTAWKAAGTWRRESKRIQPELKAELRSYGAAHFSPNLLQLLDMAEGAA